MKKNQNQKKKKLSGIPFIIGTIVWASIIVAIPESAPFVDIYMPFIKLLLVIDVLGVAGITVNDIIKSLQNKKEQNPSKTQSNELAKTINPNKTQSNELAKTINPNKTQSNKLAKTINPNNQNFKPQILMTKTQKVPTEQKTQKPNITVRNINPGNNNPTDGYPTGHQKILKRPGSNRDNGK